MGLSWGCGATQPPTVTVQLSASSAVVGDTVTVSATAAGNGDVVSGFSANVPAGQGTLTGGTVLSDGSTSASFPTGANSESGTASWVMPATPGTYTVTVSATNCATGVGQASATVTVAAQPVVLPVITGLSVASSSVLVGQSDAVTGAAQDPAGGTLTYSWTATGGSFTSVSNASTTWIAPAVGGQYTLTLTVSNGQGTATSSTAVNAVLANFQTSSDKSYAAPRRVAVGAAGEYFVVDASSGNILRMTPTGKLVGPLQVPGPMRAVTFGGNTLYATSVAGGLYAVDPLGGAPRAIPLAVPLQGPSGIAFDSSRGVLWIAESGANRARGVRLDGSTAFVLTSAAGAPLAGVDDVGFDSGMGTVWVSLDGNPSGNAAHAFDGATGKYVLSAVPYGGGAGQVTRTGGVAVDGSGRLFVSDIFQGRLQVFQRNGTAVGSVGQYGDSAGQMQLPAGLAVNPDGSLLVANMNLARVDRFATNSLPPPQNCTVNGQIDTDCDGLPDWWELKYGLNPNWAGDALLDPDHDGLTNLQEFKLGTNPLLANLPVGSGGAPVLTAPAPKTSDPGLVRFSAGLSSESSCTVAWKQKLGPSVTLRDATSLTPSFVGRTAGHYQFAGTANCGGLTSSAVLDATIRDVPPRADGGRLVVAHSGGRVALDGRFSSDANGAGMTLAWDQDSGVPLTGAVSGATLPLQLHQPGYATFQLSATDPAGNAGSAEAPVFAVSNAAAPTAVAVSPVVGAPGTLVTLDATQSVDPAGTAAYAWVQVAGAPVALSGAGTASPSFTPSAPGRYAFLVTLAAGAVRSPPAQVEVLIGNALPVASVAQSALQGAVGDPLSLDGSASAASSGGALTYAWRQVSGPAAGLTDADQAVATVVPFGPGVFAFELRVSENGVPSQAVQVAVTATSSVAGQGIPVAAANAPATAAVGSSVTLDGTQSSDPDGHLLRYRWTQVGGPWVALDDPTSATPSFRPPLSGTYAFELEVDDQSIRSAAVPVAVTAQ